MWQVWQLPATPLSAYVSARSTAGAYASARSTGDLPAPDLRTAEEGLGLCPTHVSDDSVQPGGRRRFAPLAADERKHFTGDRTDVQQLSRAGIDCGGPRRQAAPAPTPQRLTHRLPTSYAPAATQHAGVDHDAGCRRTTRDWRQQQQAPQMPRHGQVIMTTPEWAAQQRHSARLDAARQPATRQRRPDPLSAEPAAEQHLVTHAHRRWAPEQQGADAVEQRAAAGCSMCGGACAAGGDAAGRVVLQQPGGGCGGGGRDCRADTMLQGVAGEPQLPPDAGQYGYAAMARRRQQAASEAAAAAAAAAAEAQRSGSHDAGVQCTLLRPHDPNRQQLRRSSGSRAGAAAVSPPLLLPPPPLPASAPECRELSSNSRGLAAGRGRSGGGSGGATDWQQEAATSIELQQEVTPALLPAHWRGLAKRRAHEARSRAACAGSPTGADPPAPPTTPSSRGASISADDTAVTSQTIGPSEAAAAAPRNAAGACQLHHSECVCRLGRGLWTPSGADSLLRCLWLERLWVDSAGCRYITTCCRGCTRGGDYDATVMTASPASGGSSFVMTPNHCLTVPAAAAAAAAQATPEAAPLPVAGWLARFNMSAGPLIVPACRK